MLNGCYSQAVSNSFYEALECVNRQHSDPLERGKSNPFLWEASASCSWRFSVRGGNANSAFKMAPKSLENTQLNICRTYINFKNAFKILFDFISHGTQDSQIHGVGKYIGRYQGLGNRRWGRVIVYQGQSFSLGRGKIWEMDDGESCITM